jgi:V/A-type H+-transporting ATPase subunit B
MSLELDLPLEAALDEGWRILAECFEPAQTGLSNALIEAFWPSDVAPAAPAAEEAPA